MPAKQQVEEVKLKAADGAAPRQTRRETNIINRRNMTALHEKNQKLEDINQCTDKAILRLEGELETQEQDRAVDQLTIKESSKQRDNMAKSFMVSTKNNNKLRLRIKELEESFKCKEESNNQIIATQAAKLTKRKNRNSKLKQKLKLRKQQQQKSYFFNLQLYIREL